MSGNIKLNTPSSGSVTLSATDTASNLTVTVPATTGTLATTSNVSYVLLSTATASGSATISFTGLTPSSYAAFVIMGSNIVPATNAVTLSLQASVSGVFQTGSSYAHQQFRFVSGGSAVTGSTADTQININSSGDTISNSSTYGNSFSITIHNPGQTSTYKQCTWQFEGLCSDYESVIGGGMVKTASALDGFRFQMSSGNITTGSFYLYGIKNS